MTSSKSIGVALTYDDVLLVPRHSRVMPSDANLETRFTRKISLKMPLIAAAMDTVTEAGTAIVMAQAGGVGIIHKNMSVAEQAAQVKKVKKSEAGMVSLTRTSSYSSRKYGLPSRIDTNSCATVNPSMSLYCPTRVSVTIARSPRFSR